MQHAIETYQKHKRDTNDDTDTFDHERDNDDIDHWKVDGWKDEEAVPGGHLLEESSFATLFPKLPTLTPMAVYKCPTTSCPRFIIAREIETHMRSIAATVYGFHPKRDVQQLQKWSAHSLRVGACTLLHASGVSASQIKFLLRWRSDAFMVYLRNTVPLAKRQNEIWDEAMAMPHFL